MPPEPPAQRRVWPCKGSRYHKAPQTRLGKSRYDPGLLVDVTRSSGTVGLVPGGRGFSASVPVGTCVLRLRSLSRQLLLQSLLDGARESPEVRPDGEASVALRVAFGLDLACDAGHPGAVGAAADEVAQFGVRDPVTEAYRLQSTMRSLAQVE